MTLPTLPTPPPEPTDPTLLPAYYAAVTAYWQLNDIESHELIALIRRRNPPLVWDDHCPIRLPCPGHDLGMNLMISR